MVRMMVRRVYLYDFGRSGSTFDIKIYGAYDGAAYIYLCDFKPSDPFFESPKGTCLPRAAPSIEKWSSDGPWRVRGAAPGFPISWVAWGETPEREKKQPPEERHLKSVGLPSHDAATYLQILYPGLRPQK